ncbi:nucleotide exchange factor GrpE [Vibrio comitans]
MQENELDTTVISTEALEILNSEVQALELKTKQQRTEILRAKADAENSRRRSEKEIEKVRLYSLSKYNEALIPVIDSLELALANSTKASDHHSQGLAITYDMLINTVEKFGLVSINPMGEPFDPKYHDAIATEKSSVANTQNTVINVLQKGYLLNDRVIRPALVVVSS